MFFFPIKAATLARWTATRLPWLGSCPAGQLHDRQRGDLGKSVENLGTYGFRWPIHSMGEKHPEVWENGHL